jgi:hypothetical protein
VTQGVAFDRRLERPLPKIVAVSKEHHTVFEDIRFTASKPTTKTPIKIEVQLTVVRTRQRPTAGAPGWQLPGNRKIFTVEVP